MLQFCITLLMVAESVYSAEAMGLCRFATTFPCRGKCCPLPAKVTVPVNLEKSIKLRAVKDESPNSLPDFPNSLPTLTTVSSVETSWHDHLPVKESFLHLYAPNELPQTTSTENIMETTIRSCETTKEAWVNDDCSKRCTCYENQWVCNSTHECGENAACIALEGAGRCVCKTGYTGKGETCKPFYRDCKDVYEDGHTQNGVYTILPTDWPGTPFNVSCDMETPGGGWTIFQRRVDGQTNFYRNWTSYKSGFGSLDQGNDFWIGNEKLFYLTNQRVYQLRVDIVSASGVSKYQQYEAFRIGNESSHYQLMDLGTNVGIKLDHGLRFAEGGYFSTYDNDNDRCHLFNCAREHHGAWWYTNTWCRSCHVRGASCNKFVINSTCHNMCTYSNLNGDHNGGNGKSMSWNIRYNCHVSSSYMKITPNL